MSTTGPTPRPADGTDGADRTDDATQVIETGGRARTEDDATQVIETGSSTRVVETGDETQVIETTGDTRVIETGGDTVVIESAEGTEVVETEVAAAPGEDDPGTPGPEPVRTTAFAATPSTPPTPAPTTPTPTADPYGTAPSSTGSSGTGPYGTGSYGAGPSGPSGPAGTGPHGPTGPTGPWTASAPTPAPVPVPEDRGPRSGTVVWGLVVAAIGVGILAMAAGARIDAQLALITLLAGAGAALLIGSVVSAARRRGRERAARG